MSTENGSGSLVPVLAVILVLGGAAGFFIYKRLEPARSSLKGSRIRANEMSAIAALRTIATAEHIYRDQSDDRKYVPLSILSSTTPTYIDSRLGDGQKAGYCFRLSLGTSGGSGYQVQADPIDSGKSGVRHFFLDHSGEIRVNEKIPAGAKDPLVE